MRALTAAAFALPPVLAVVPKIKDHAVLAEGYSNSGAKAYATGATGTFAVPAGRGRGLAAFVLYLAREAFVPTPETPERTFAAPTFGGEAMAEAIAPTSDGDKGRPGVAAYLLPAPPTGEQTFAFEAGEDLLSLAVVLVALDGLDASPLLDAVGASPADNASGIEASFDLLGPALLLGAGVLQGHDGHPAEAAGGARLVASGASNTANVFNDLAYALASLEAPKRGPRRPGLRFAASDGIAHGWLALKGYAGVSAPAVVAASPATGAAVGLRHRPPAPAATLDVLAVGPGDNVRAGSKDADLLIVLPEAPLTSAWRVDCTGYRGYYCVGGRMPLAALGTQTAPDGRLVRGQNAWFRLQSPADAVGAFVYIARLHLTNDPDRIDPGHSQYGDVVNTGAVVSADVDNFAAWPDVYLDNVLVEGGLFGWGASLVAHSDLWKSERGANRRLFVNRLDAPFGYQHFYGLTYQTRDADGLFRPHPSAERHFHDTVLRLIRTKGNGAKWWKDHPKAFFLSRGDANLKAGEYEPTTFHEAGVTGGEGEGQGVFVSGRTAAVDNFHPRGGDFAPVLAGGAWTWPADPPVSGRPFVAGRVRDGLPPVPVVTPADVGPGYRVADRAGLEALIQHFNGG